MNIFDVLNSGKGRINEENVSAMLRFLLDPAAAHGLGAVFLHRFIAALQLRNRDADALGSEYAVEVMLEQSYEVPESGRSRSVDIELVLFRRPSAGSTGDVEILRRIAIENKIRSGSADRDQLREEYLAIRGDADVSVPITMVFLTSAGKGALAAEFEALSAELLGTDSKVWMRWCDAKEIEPASIVDIIRSILEDESKCKIDPIADAVRHILRAFVVHIERTQIAPLRATRETMDASDIVDQLNLEFGGKHYTIVQHASQTIRVWNEEGEEVSPTKPFLRQVNEGLGLGLALHHPTGTVKTTRQLGSAVMAALRAGKQGQMPLHHGR
jgi:hypothetical protein